MYIGDDIVGAGAGAVANRARPAQHDKLGMGDLCCRGRKGGPVARASHLDTSIVWIEA